MNILVTGAKGMVGTALCNNLKNIRDGKNKTRPALHIEEIYEYDLDSTAEQLDKYCQKSGFCVQSGWCESSGKPGRLHEGQLRLCIRSAELSEKAQQ